MSTMTDPVTGEKFTFLTRAELRLRAPRHVSKIRNTLDGDFIHHAVSPTAPEEAVWRSTQNYHMDAKRWSDIAYSFGWTNSGHILEGRGWGAAGGHTQDHNHSSHAFCFVGNTDNDLITDAAKRACLCLVRTSRARYGHNLLRGHGEVGQTGCPGKNGRLFVSEARTRLLQKPTTPSPQGEDEMTEADWERMEKMNRRIAEEVVHEHADKLAKVLSGSGVNDYWEDKSEVMNLSRVRNTVLGIPE